ncbi:hypothetical protein OAG07_02085 [Verrucomicrobia bacterium]|nr:hypothetical protein [Verrucomicrobiota bacterium]MDB4485020.1 hypothetical protein [bacterium]MDB4642238.1 hypothetical protein [Verrucomicrobiota bacterium]MDB4691773.1 hypothetical protein [Verrucomicrobiota bacterium]
MKTVQRKVTMLLYKRGLSHSQRWFHFFPSVDLILQLKVVPLNVDERVLEHMVKEDRTLFLEEGIPHQYIQLWVESRASLQQVIQNFLSKALFGIFCPASLEPHPVKSHTALPLA